MISEEKKRQQEKNGYFYNCCFSYKSFLFILVFILLNLGFVLASSLSISPSAKTVNKGERFFLDINAENISELYGFQLDINYNQNFLKYLSISEGDFLKSDGATTFSVTPDNSTAGKIRNYAVTRIMKKNGVNGTGVLATVEFEAMNFGSSVVYLSNDKLYNSDTNEISHSTRNSTLNVIEQVPCTLASAYWSRSSAIINESVELRVNGTNCQGKEINYTIWKNIPFWFDKKVFQTSSSGSTNWQAGLKSDGNYETGNYYFRAVSNDGSNEVNSQSFGNDLQVNPAPPVCVDNDKDGYNITAGCGAIDCNDNNASIWKNINGYIDNDKDGYGTGSVLSVCTNGTLLRGYSNNNLDCNDNNNLVYPNAVEICDGIDNNCVFGIDENNGDCSGSKSYCVSGKCVQCTSNSQCDDKLFCNGQETCLAGACQSGIAPTIDDGIPCTIDSCDEINDKKVNLPDNSKCDDGLYCNGVGYCDISLGCQQINKPNCSDSIACTIDSCDEGSNLTDNIGSCKYDTKNCACTKLNEKVDCNDNNPCTDDICNSELKCQNVNNNSNSCSDNLFCTINDKCSNGRCIGDIKSVDDNISCTIDSCDEAQDKIINIANNSYCNDNLFCNGMEICNTLLGCQQGIKPDCSDGIFDTIDFCNETSNKCEHKEIEYEEKLPLCINVSYKFGILIFRFNNSKCDDNQECTIDRCTREGCKNVFDLMNVTCLNMIKNCSDKDEDGILDYDALTCLIGKDKCIIKKSNLTLANLSYLKPLSRIINISYNLTEDLRNISEFRIYKEKIAEIKFKNRLDLVRINESGCFHPLNIDPLIEINDKKIKIYSEDYPEFNKSATIIFYNISFAEPKIKRDGAECKDCRIVSYDSALKILIVEVPGFSEYEIIEGASAPVTPSGGGSSAGGSGGAGTTPRLCIENWSCGEWQECSNGVQMRACEDLNNCKTEKEKPETKKSCEIETEKPAEMQTRLGDIAQTIRLNIKLIIIIAVILLAAVLIIIYALIRRKKSKEGKIKEGKITKN